MHKSLKSFKILAVGNSFSDNSLKYVYQILNAFGFEEIVVSNLYIGGCSLNTHANNIKGNLKAYTYRKNTTGEFISKDETTMLEGLLDEKWDYITLQQASNYSGDISTYNEDLYYIEEYLNKTCPNAIKAWHMTWAYSKDSSHPNFPFYNKDQNYMYQCIIKCVKEKISNRDYYDYIIPCGTAIQNARTSYLLDTLTADGFHLEQLGEFIAGLTYILVLGRFDINDLNLNLIPQRFVPYMDVVKESVLNAIENPYQVTHSKLLIDPYFISNSCDYVKETYQYSEDKRCLLDMYIPQQEKFDVIIHFHGGGIHEGSRCDEAHVNMGDFIAKNGVSFISCDYRMYPNAAYPDFIIDCAKAIKFVKETLSTKINKLYISGQSAGAYFAMMLAFNKSFLNNEGLSINDIDGWIIESGQPTTHFNVLSEEGLNNQLQRIDEKAPLYYVNENTSFNKMLLISYTNDIPCRLNQNKLLFDSLKMFDSQLPVELRILEGTHCICSTYPYRSNYVYSKIVLEFVKK